MKKSLTSVLVSAALTVTCFNASAEDLLTVYQQALANDPTVIKAKAQFDAAEQDVVRARAVLYPQLNGFVSLSDGESETISETTGNVITIEAENTSYGATLSMQLYHHDSWLRMDNAKKGAHQLDILYQTSKQQLALRVTQAYFNVLGALDDLEFAKAEKAAIARQLEQTKQRFEVGLTAITDVHEAQAQFDNAITEEIRAQNTVYNAEEALRTITNVYPSNLHVLNTERFGTARPLPDSANEWQQMAETKNLDLIAQKIGLDIAKENINIARSGHYPTLDFSGRYTSSEDTFGSLNNPALDSHSIGITLNVPIYSGGATTSAVKKAQHNYVAASQDMEATYRNVVRNTRNAYNTVIAAISAIKALEQAVISAESALKATEAGFEVGTRTIVDVLNSTRNLYNAKRNLSSTRYGYIQSVLNLKQAGGTITEQDIIDINQGLTAAK